MAKRKKIELPPPRSEEWAGRELLSRKHATLLAVNVHPTSEAGAAVFELAFEYIAVDRDPLDQSLDLDWRGKAIQREQRLAERREFDAASDNIEDQIERLREATRVGIDAALVETAGDKIKHRVEKDHPKKVAEAIHVWHTIYEGVVSGRITEAPYEQARLVEDREISVSELVSYLAEKNIGWPFSSETNGAEKIALTLPGVVGNGGGGANDEFLKSFDRWEDLRITLGVNGRTRIMHTVTKDSRVIAGIDLGLLNKKTTHTQPTVLHTMLREMAAGKETPTSKRARVSKLRVILQSVFDIKSDPFEQTSRGYMPVFEIKDAIQSADDKARAQAGHVSFNEDFHTPRDFEDENDAAGKLIRNE